MTRLGGSYLTDMKNLRDQDEQLDKIREFFLEKDKNLTEKNDRMNKILDRCSEVSYISYIQIELSTLVLLPEM